METAYCLRHMLELKPPVPHPNLLSSSIFVSEDFAAKVKFQYISCTVNDIYDFWKEIFANVKTHGDDDLEHSEPPFLPLLQTMFTVIRNSFWKGAMF
ncbi:unnamed protein product [Musa textilis]